MLMLAILIIIQDGIMPCRNLSFCSLFHYQSIKILKKKIKMLNFPLSHMRLVKGKIKNPAAGVFSAEFQKGCAGL